MGAWGVGPLENDAALDVVAAWKSQLAKARAMAPEGWTANRIVDWYLEHGLGETIDWGDIDTTSRLIAIAELLLQEGIAITGEAREYFDEAINWELQKEALQEWDKPKERSQALEDLLSRIGGKRRRITKSTLFRHPAVDFNSQAELLKKCEHWVITFKEGRYDPAIDKEYPRLWHVLDRLMASRLQIAGSDVNDEAKAQRLILLAAYVGWKLDLSVEEIMELARKAKGKRPMFGYQTDRWNEYCAADGTSD